MGCALLRWMMGRRVPESNVLLNECGVVVSLRFDKGKVGVVRHVVACRCALRCSKPGLPPRKANRSQDRRTSMVVWWLLL